MNGGFGWDPNHISNKHILQAILDYLKAALPVCGLVGEKLRRQNLLLQ